jgi:precorrin isomerase
MRQFIGLSFGLVELFRRFIWNCGDFRAVRDISIAPLSNNIGYALIEYKLGKESGIRNRRKTVPSAMMIDEEKMMTTNDITVFGNNPTFTCDNTLVLDVNESHGIHKPSFVVISG